MYDYIEITKCLDKDTPYFGNLKEYSRGDGWISYKLEGCKELKITHSINDNRLTIRGSLPYFLKGHNFSFSNKEFTEAINLLGGLLDVSLWDANVKALEYGTIFQVDGNTKIIIKNHVSDMGLKLLENSIPKHRGYFKWWERTDESMKLYDAKRNITKKQTINKRKAIEEDGFDPSKEYLKWEMHLNNVTKFNHDKVLKLEKLMLPKTIQRMNEELIRRYSLLTKMKEVAKPTSKADYSSLDIVLSELVQLKMNYGSSIEATRKELYAVINNIDCLTIADKNKRKETIRRAFKKMHTEDMSKWDLTDKIHEALSMEK